MNDVIGEVTMRRYDFKAERWSRDGESITLTTATDPFFVWGIDPLLFQARHGPRAKAGVVLRMSRMTLARWMAIDPGWCRPFRAVCVIEVRGSALSRKARSNRPIESRAATDKEGS